MYKILYAINDVYKTKILINSSYFPFALLLIDSYNALKNQTLVFDVLMKCF